MSRGKFLFILAQCRLFLHLVLGTKRFGVNGWWVAPLCYQSTFGVSFPRQFFNCLAIYPLIRRYRAIKWRMGVTVGFVPMGHPSFLMDFSFFSDRCSGYKKLRKDNTI